MRCLLDERIRLVDLDLDDPRQADLVEGLEKRFTHENPVYWDARRNRRPCRHIPREIRLFRRDGEAEVSLPRGVSGLVRSLVAPFGAPVEDRRAAPPVVLPPFQGELRAYQQEAVDRLVEAEDGVLQAPTGSGKTVITAALISRVQVRTLILVHTGVLLDQTVERMRAFLGVDPGVIGGGREEMGDVTVAMVQTLRRRDLAPLREAFGMVVLDECHHCPADSFQHLVQAFASRWRIGLTATPTRKDRLHPVLYEVMGPLVHRVPARDLVAGGALVPVEVVEVETSFEARYRRDYARLVERLVRDPERNACIVEHVERYHGQRSLVLTDRVDHCHWLAEALGRRGLRVAALTGEVPREDRQQVLARLAGGGIEVLVATTSLVGEGFDLPELDTVFLTTPSGNVARTTQSLGRALRPSPGKTRAVVVDFVDRRVPLLRNQAVRRARVYRGFRG